MKQAVNEMVKPKSANVFNKLLVDRRRREPRELSAPKPGYAMRSSNKISNPGFQFLSDISNIPLEGDEPIKCEVCGIETKSNFHV